MTKRRSVSPSPKGTRISLIFMIISSISFHQFIKNMYELSLIQVRVTFSHRCGTHSRPKRTTSRVLFIPHSTDAETIRSVHSHRCILHEKNSRLFNHRWVHDVDLFCLFIFLVLVFLLFLWTHRKKCWLVHSVSLQKQGFSRHQQNTLRHRPGPRGFVRRVDIKYEGNNVRLLQSIIFNWN